MLNFNTPSVTYPSLPLKKWLIGFLQSETLQLPALPVLRCFIRTKPINLMRRLNLLSIQQVIRNACMNQIRFLVRPANAEGAERTSTQCNHRVVSFSAGVQI